MTHTGLTFVLVHGAWHSAPCWDRVLPLLEAAGHQALALSLTGYGDRAHLLTPQVGLDTHVQDVVTLLLERDLHDVVLVGHSYAGMVITSAAHRVPERIAHLVYVDAMLPADGQSVLDVIPAAQTLLDLAARSPTPWRIPPLPEMPAPDGLFGVTDPADLAWLRSMLSDAPALTFQQPAHADNALARSVPATHIQCVGQDAGAPARPALPERQPNGEPTRIWQLRSGHDCMITAPDALTRLLLAL